ncbi:MAG TPA: toxic anion resistance protein [Polyangiales bacterium]|nr:toxic anion resistance protein [Polyangiales bacterium]
MTGEAELVLTPPAPVAKVEPEKAAGLVPLDDGQKGELNKRVDGFISELMALDPNSPAFGEKAALLSSVGKREIAEAAGQSNRFLERPVKAMNSESNVGNDLTALRRTVEDLDPGKRGNLLGAKKLLGVLPFGNKLRDYFDEYRSAQSHIAAILTRLESGKSELLKDNAAIDVERQALWHAMGRLEQMIHVSKALDRGLAAKADELEMSDPSRAKAIRDTALFYVRQRTTDLLTQMAVSVQGYLALDLVKRSNIELMKGVERASTTTVSALRTAVTVAQALTNQKLVLQQITALNTTTSGIIESTAEMLKNQTADIHKQAAASTIPIDTLKKAFDNIYQTMDAIDEFKAQALTSMQTTVDALSGEIERSRGYIARSEGASQALTSGTAEPFRLPD